MKPSPPITIIKLHFDNEKGFIFFNWKKYCKELFSTEINLTKIKPSKNAILNLIKNKTTLVIAHRLSTIHNADKIFVLKSGNIINSGNHEFLIKNCEEYKSLYEKQLK